MVGIAMVLRSQKEKPASAEMEPVAGAASRYANSPQIEAESSEAPSLNDPSNPANANPENLTQALTEDMRQKLVASETQFALSFMRVLSVLLRSPHYKHYALSDLEWLVVPPLRTGQCAILHAEKSGLPIATAVALWASVSPEVDIRLSREAAAPLRLRPDEWRSGEILWLIDLIGTQDNCAQLLQQLQRDPFNGRDVKIRQRGTDGSVNVATLSTRTK
jgi:hemolysin-activating ACP:hemolysin acyltransferase